MARYSPYRNYRRHAVLDWWALLLLTLASALALLPATAEALDAMPAGSLKAYAVSGDSSEMRRANILSSGTEMPSGNKVLFRTGEGASAAVIVTGYSRDDDGRVDIDASFHFIANDGRLLFRRDAYARARRRITQETGFISLAPALEISFDSNDPPGKYRLEFIVTDNISHHRTKTELILTLERRGRPASVAARRLQRPTEPAR